MSAFAKIEVQSDDGARATVYEHGAHVTSWVTPDGIERLFLSPRAEFAAGKAIRGGVPIIFPQFNQRGPLPRHGFVRTGLWQVLSQVIQHEAGEARLTLQVTDEAKTLWPHQYAITYTVRVGGNDLALMLSVQNLGDAPFTFTGALHTYLQVDDVRAVRIDGLSGLRCEDSVAGKTYIEDADVVTITAETDRIYYDAVGALVVAEPGRTMWLKQTGFCDVVVWNPWTSAANLRDMEPGGYLRMVCVEAAVIGEPATVLPGDTWVGTQHLRVV